MMKRSVNQCELDGMEIPTEVWKEILSWMGIRGKMRYGQTSKKNNVLATESVVSAKPVHFRWNGEDLMNDEILSRFYALERLDLSSDNVITENGLVNLTRLKFLRLGWCSREITDYALSKLTTLTSLHLTGTTKISEKSLLCLPRLTSLNLFGDNMVYPPMLLQLTNLTELNINNNDFVKDCDISRLINLTSLSMENNPQISHSLTRLVCLKKLILRDNRRIDDKILTHLHSLEVLSISVNTTISGECFSSLTKLKVLTILSGNRLEYHHMVMLTNLTELNLPVYGDHLDNDTLTRLTRLVTLRLGFGSSGRMTFETLQSLKSLRWLSPMGEKFCGVQLPKHISLF